MNKSLFILMTSLLCAHSALADQTTAPAVSTKLECTISTTHPEKQANGTEKIAYESAAPPLIVSSFQPPKPGFRPMATIKQDTADGLYRVEIQGTRMDDGTAQIVYVITNLKLNVYTDSYVTTLLPGRNFSSRFVVPLQNPDPQLYPGGFQYQGSTEKAGTGADFTCFLQ